MKPPASIAARVIIALFLALVAVATGAAAACVSGGGGQQPSPPPLDPGKMRLAISIVGAGTVRVTLGPKVNVECAYTDPPSDPTYRCYYDVTAGTTVLTAEALFADKFLRWESGGAVIATTQTLDVAIVAGDYGKTKIITAVFGTPVGDAGPDSDTGTPTDAGDASDTGETSAPTATLVDSASRFPPITLSGWKCATDPSYGWVLQYTLGPDFGAAVGIDAGTGTFVVFVSIEGAQIRKVSGVLNDILWQSSTPISLTTDTSGNLPTMVMTASPVYTGTMTLSGHYDCK
jgi:hypothetical protein